MDQGLAAVVAGVVGMVGALGGSIAGGIGAVRGARIGAERTASALLQQTQDQADIEHRHWAREQRRLACTQIMDLYSASNRARAMCVGALARGQVPGDEEHLEQDRAALALASAGNHLKLWGPPQLSDAADDLVLRASTASYLLKHWIEAVQASASNVGEIRAEYEAVSLQEAYLLFVDVAGQTLRNPEQV
ncbi:hypothetical protein [Streptomyces chartreusis]|uniref:hypothetical protein n=1 Tax=Streptomyces chartreusis TaxID=1969 RepID=UPI0033D2C2CC